MAELKHDWPNLVGDDFLFWSEEWRKHARCIKDMTPHKYFDLALDVMGQVGPLVELLVDRKGLKPNKNRLVQTQDFPSAIEKQLNTIAEVKCNTDKNDQSQIHELYFCASLHGVLVNCTSDRKKPRPPYKIRHCPTEILYPSNPSTPLVPATPLSMIIPATQVTITIPGTPLTMTIPTQPIYIALTFAICVFLRYVW
ncbi:hypothetical protein Vadar_010947 [Vaccinium darrowii]|uniref:Uncharacterized protein n=1 Tax=Vaccinium darrowii TaxID=229202 RepID=A0ACB7XYB6_9ERIC|nr:hypothetical protein Vadar_010947 [Vaccinium darrowii]